MSSEADRRTTRAYNKALAALQKKYKQEYLEYRDTKAWGETWKQKHNSAVRYLRFRHPRVFRRLYQSFKELEV